MGTASLVFGLILIIVGFYILFFVGSYVDVYAMLAMLTLGVPLIVIGGLLLRKYDRDRKKDKTP